MMKILKLKLVILLEYLYKNIFAKGYVPNRSEEIFVIRKVKNTVPWTYIISDLNEEEIPVYKLRSCCTFSIYCDMTYKFFILHRTDVFECMTHGTILGDKTSRRNKKKFQEKCATTYRNKKCNKKRTKIKLHF